MNKKFKISHEPLHRLERARYALAGLSVGDSLGERFALHPSVAQQLIDSRELPKAPWKFTDDTQTALSIVACLEKFGNIDQYWLASSLAESYDPSREYGVAMHLHLAEIRSGTSWKDSAESLFSGQGSFGNGSAMRVAPLGAYFADDLDLVVAQAELSSKVTHTHPEAIAGAIAVALAAAISYRCRVMQDVPEPRDFLDQVLARVPQTAVRDGLQKARDLPPNADLNLAVKTLGNGNRISAQDTVPFTLWSASRYLNNYPEAIWQTMRALGDIDTNCAIVGGIVASFTGILGIPEPWLQSSEPLPIWPDDDFDPGLVESIPILNSTASFERKNINKIWFALGPRAIAQLQANSFKQLPFPHPQQIILYAFTDENFARQVARKWIACRFGLGAVVCLAVKKNFVASYSLHRWGDPPHGEYWIPSSDIYKLNKSITGEIKVVEVFRT